MQADLIPVVDVVMKILGILVLVMILGYTVYGETQEEEQAVGEFPPSDCQKIIRSAFSNVAAHIFNLAALQMTVDEFVTECISIDGVVRDLESRMDKVEITFRTDMRILINEIQHLKERKSSR